MKPLADAKDLAVLTRQSQAKIYSDVREGKLRACRFGRNIRFTEEAVEAYIASAFCQSNDGDAA